MTASGPTSPDAEATPDAGRSAAHKAGERAAKNMVARITGEIVGKVASLVLFALLARQVGDARFGVFVFALAWAEVAMTPVGLGIDQFMVRQVAADKSRLDAYFLNAVVLKVARGIPIVAGSIVLVHLLDYSHETELTVSILSVALLFETMARTPQSVFNAFERGELVATAIAVQRILAASAGIAVLLAGYGVVAVAITYSLGALVRALLSIDLMRRRVRWPHMVAPAGARRELRRRSLPFMTQDLFGLVLNRADVLLLAALAADAVVGQYGAAYRLYEATTFIVVALSGAFAAMFSYLGPDTDPPLAAVFQRSIKLALATLLPISVTLALLAEPLLRSFFGAEFAAAEEPLMLLAPVPALWGVMVLANVLVLSREHPRRMVYTVALAAVANLGLNLALIPPLGASGAALAMLGSTALYVVVAFWLALLEAGRIQWLSMLAAPVGAAAAMALPLLLVPGVWPLAAAAGVAVYLAVYAAIDRLVDPDDLRFVVGLIRRRLPLGREAAEGQAQA
jgi:O-antigen/teichoic acid export membrane protein